MIYVKRPGDPYGKASHRYGRGFVYADPSYTAYKHDIAHLVSGKVPAPMVAPVVVIVAVKARPQRKPKDYPLQWTAARNPCLAKPDVDNVAKATLDALKYAGVYRDDAQVYGCTVWTFYAAENEGPCTEIWISDIEDHGRPLVAAIA